MTENLERLVVQLSADVKKYENALNKASQQTNRAMGKVEKRTKQMAGNLSSTFAAAGASFATKFIAPIAALGVAGVVREVGAIARGIAEIGDEAERAGLSVQAFQELQYVAQQNRISIDALTDGFKELSLRADEFIVTGAGSGAESFQRLGYDAESLAAALENPSALFTEIIGKLENLDRAAQIRIADELFGGTGGEQFVQLIDQGADGIQATIDRAHELGIVMSDELITRAAELDRKFNEVSTTVGTALKTAIVDAASALGDFLNMFETFDRQSTGNLEARLKAERDTREAYGIPGTDAFEASLNREAEILAELEARAFNTLRAGLAGLPSNRTPTTPGTPPRSGQSAAAREAAAVLRLIDALEWERDSLGMTARELAVANALRDAGTAATVAQREQIAELAAANFDLAQAQDEALDSMQEWSDIGRSLVRGLIDDLREGKSAAEALGNAFGKLGDKFLDLSLNSLFGSGGNDFGILGALFGLGGGIGGSPINLLAAKGRVFSDGHLTKFANGGVVSRPTTFSYGGGTGLMGEAGDEAVMPLMRAPNGKLGVSAMGAGVNRVLIELGDGLVASVIEQAGVNSVQVVNARVPGMIRSGSPAAVARAQRNHKI